MHEYDHLHDVFRRVLRGEPAEPEGQSESEKDTQSSQSSTTSPSTPVIRSSGSRVSTSPMLPTSKE